MATDAGMFALWSPSSFADIVDYDTWEAELLEDNDIQRHTTAGTLVPLNIGGDGAFGVLARVGTATVPANLTPRERQYVLATSDPYLFTTPGGARISGIEHIGADADAALDVPLPPGRWSVTVTLIKWEAEPGQQDADGNPTPTALPDFILLIDPEQQNRDYRTGITTFER